ncbi:MAG: DNA polymerase III subunit delta [Candidatus Zixiibacteriota bacterium]
MEPTQLLKEVGSGKFRPIYYFYGDEDFRKKEAVKFIITNYLPGKNAQLSVTRMSADKDSLETISAELSAIPMLGGRRVIHVDDIQKLNPSQYKKLFALLTIPPPETVVVLSSPSARTPQKKSAFFREVQSIAETVAFDKLTGQSARGRIVRHLQSAGLTYDEDAVDLLALMTSGNFGGLMGELEKLTLSYDKGSHIGLDEIRKLTSSYEEFGIFELIDLVAERKYEPALKAYTDLLRRGSNAGGVIVLMSRHIMNMLRVIEGRKVAGHPFWVTKLRNQAQRYGQERVVSAITSLARTERDIRLSKLPPDLLVENLIREISR